MQLRARFNAKPPLKCEAVEGTPAREFSGAVMIEALI
jgi:hypothetical protein